MAVQKTTAATDDGSAGGTAETPKKTTTATESTKSQQTTPQEEAAKNGMFYSPTSGLQGYNRNTAANRNRGTDRNDLNGEQDALTASREKASVNSAITGIAPGQFSQESGATKPGAGPLASTAPKAQEQVQSTVNQKNPAMADWVKNAQAQVDGVVNPADGNASSDGSPSESTGGGTTPRPNTSGGGSGTPASGTTPSSGTAETPQDAVDSVVNPEPTENTTSRIVNSITAPDTSNVTGLSKVDTSGMEDTINQIADSATQQANLQIDKTVNDSVNELERQKEDAAIEYQNQRDQINASEALAKDNQALYAEARGDRGGIGQAQYDSIQNTAATNRQNVNLAQEKLATDVARQIEDLRANGEFQKADALLTVTQNKLSQLMQLEQWATEANLTVDQFNAELEKWKANLDLEIQQLKINTELSAANVTGAFADGTSTLAAQQKMDEQLANVGAALIAQGIMPSESQWKALGYESAEQVQKYIDSTKKKSGGGGGGQLITVVDAAGNESVMSVLQFQKEYGNGLPQTGKLDAATTAALNATVANNNRGVTDGQSSWANFDPTAAAQ